MRILAARARPWGRTGAWVVLGLALAWSPGCGTREYENPLDPRNPATGGSAPVLNAVGGDAEVALAWSDLGLVDLVELRVLRWLTPGPVETLAVFPPGAGAWVDRGVVNGTSYEYRLGFVIGGDPVDGRSNTDRATPGAERVWVVDERRGGLYRVSPDGRDLAWKLSYDGYLRSVTVEADRPRVWTISWSGDEVLGIDSTGVLEMRFSVESPRRIAASSADDGLWVAGSWGVGLHRYTGEWAFEDSTVMEPKDIAVDQTRGTVWVAEGTGSVWMRRSDGTTDRFGGFAYPFSLALDRDGGDAWLVDAGEGRVYRLAEDGAGVLGWTGGFAQPVDVAAAPDGAAWVVDWEAGSLVRLDDEMERTRVVGGFDRPRAVETDPSSGACWVVEAYGGKVWKLSAEGDRLDSASGLDFPKDIAIDPGKRNHGNPR